MSRDEDTRREDEQLSELFVDVHGRGGRAPDFELMWGAAEREARRGRSPAALLVAAIVLLALGGALWGFGARQGLPPVRDATQLVEVDHDRPSPLPFDAASVRAADELAELDSWDAPTDFLLEEPIAESRLLFEEAPGFGVSDELVF